jgi:hypothetical protein
MSEINKSLQEEYPKEKSNKTDNSNYILGTVINSKDKTVIFGASIHIWSSVSKASVKSNGNFFLTIPDFLKTDSILLEIRHAIYESKMISFSLKNCASFLTIELDPIKKEHVSLKRRRWRIFKLYYSKKFLH